MLQTSEAAPPGSGAQEVLDDEKETGGGCLWQKLLRSMPGILGSDQNKDSSEVRHDKIERCSEICQTEKNESKTES